MTHFLNQFTPTLYSRIDTSIRGCGLFMKNSTVVIILSLLLSACATSSLNVKLFTAVRKNELAETQQLLADGANVNATETDKTTALNTHSTPLIVAAGKEYEEMVLMLLSHGADVNMTSKYGSTALSESAVKGNLAIVKKLLEAGAFVDSANKWGKTPLMWAADYGHVETVEILLKAGANPKLEDEDGLTALDFAQQGNHQGVVNLLVPEKNAVGE